MASLVAHPATSSAGMGRPSRLAALNPPPEHLVSHAAVALDYIVQLGGGTRAGAAQVLGELFLVEPALLTAALAHALVQDRALHEATRLALPWPTDHEHRVSWVRRDALRPVVVGWVQRAGGEYHGQVFPEDGREVDMGAYLTREEAQAAVDAELRDCGWHLLPVTTPNDRS